MGVAHMQYLFVQRGVRHFARPHSEHLSGADGKYLDVQLLLKGVGKEISGENLPKIKLSLTPTCFP